MESKLGKDKETVARLFLLFRAVFVWPVCQLSEGEGEAGNAGHGLLYISKITIACRCLTLTRCVALQRRSAAAAVAEAAKRVSK